MRIYVGNLPYDCSEDDLKEIFGDFTVASAKLITDRDTGRSKGFGFIDIESNEEGQKAIDELDKKEFSGRPLTVNEARPREDAPRGGNRRFR
ncbi:MAG: hypothetical protein K940chlam9_01417 [Chlamydiae bacterium]|nr:hypothetical protein [Chlamydiota bacterium]